MKGRAGVDQGNLSVTNEGSGKNTKNENVLLKKER